MAGERLAAYLKGRLKSPFSKAQSEKRRKCEHAGFKPWRPLLPGVPIAIGIAGKRRPLRALDLAMGGGIPEVLVQIASKL
jgi:hypothetical protein